MEMKAKVIFFVSPLYRSKSDGLADDEESVDGTGHTNAVLIPRPQVGPQFHEEPPSIRPGKDNDSL